MCWPQYFCESEGGQSNLPLLTTELSGLQFGGVLYPIILHHGNCGNCRCHYLLDRQATKLSVWGRWATYLSSWYGQKIGGDCLGDRQWWGLLCLGCKNATLKDVLYLTDILIVTNTSAIWNVSNMINNWGGGAPPWLYMNKLTIHSNERFL